MYELNDKIKALTPYDPISGNYRIRLDANESFLEPDEGMMEKITAAVQGVAYNRYPDPTAKELRRIIGAYFGVDPQLVTCGNGSDELLGVLIGAFLTAGDRLLTLSPDFSMYRLYGEIYGAENVVYDKGPDLTVDVDRLLSMLQKDPKLRMVLFSNPCNPTSKGISAAECERLIRNAGNCLIVLDEAYMDFFDESESFVRRVEEFDNLIVLRTCSKAFGLAAIRLGIAFANPRLTSALTAVKSPYNVNSLTQAVAAALLADKELLWKRTAQIKESRDALYEALKHFTGGILKRVLIPQTNFVLLDFGDSGTAERVFYGLLDTYSIAVRHMGRYLRITAGTEEENKAVVQALKNLLDMDFIDRKG